MRGVPCPHDYRGLLGDYDQLTAMWCWLQTGDNRWLTIGHGANPLINGKRKTDEVVYAIPK
jgi:UDP-N-acetylenolpyruvoylglucosamine reductase